MQRVENTIFKLKKKCNKVTEEVTEAIFPDNGKILLTPDEFDHLISKYEPSIDKLESMNFF